MIYLDYAATSAFKPECVYEASDNALRKKAGNPGRSGHMLSIEAGKTVMEARGCISDFFHAENSQSIVFCSNCTDALNLAIYGILKPGDHVITSCVEHNSVARPLEHLKDEGIYVTKLNTSIETGVNPQDVKNSIGANTKMVILTHMSNVTGTINDIEAVGAICRECGVLFLVDAAQSAGLLPIDVQRMCVDLLAFPGHKGLYGPQGTGGLYIRPGLNLKPLKQGGTGSKSEMLHQPEDMPDKYESGTLNVSGIAGLGAGVKFVADMGVNKIFAHETALTQRFVTGLSKISGVHIVPPAGERGPVVSLNVDGFDSQEVAVMLDQVFGIAVRSGLHCAPDAHRTAKTLDGGGTVRISPGFFTTEEEIDACIQGIALIAQGEI